MASDETNAPRWFLSIEGEGSNPDHDKLSVTRGRPSQIRLEISAPGIRSAGEDQVRLATQAIQGALSDLQQALDSQSGIVGLHDRES